MNAKDWDEAYGKHMHDAFVAAYSERQYGIDSRSKFHSEIGNGLHGIGGAKSVAHHKFVRVNGKRPIWS